MAVRYVPLTWKFHACLCVILTANLYVLTLYLYDPVIYEAYELFVVMVGSGGTGALAMLLFVDWRARYVARRQAGA